MERIMVTIPECQLTEVDTIARQRGVSRSQFVREALIERVERLRQAEFEALLAEGYQSMAGALQEAAGEAVLAQAAASEAWHWDD